MKTLQSISMPLPKKQGKERRKKEHEFLGGGRGEVTSRMTTIGRFREPGNAAKGANTKE